MNSITKKRVRITDVLLYGLIYLSAAFSVLLIYVQTMKYTKVK